MKHTVAVFFQKLAPLRFGPDVSFRHNNSVKFENVHLGLNFMSRRAINITGDSRSDARNSAQIHQPEELFAQGSQRKAPGKTTLNNKLGVCSYNSGVCIYKIVYPTAKTM